MRLIHNGDKLNYRGQAFSVGGGICATSGDFKGLYGVIREIWDGTDTFLSDSPPQLFCMFYPPVNCELKEQIIRKNMEFSGRHKSGEEIFVKEVVLRASEARPMKKCRVYQVDGANGRFLFQSFDTIKEMGFSAPPRSVYRMVFDSPLETDDLEEIFFLFNCHHPKGFTGHSLTTSDIVELYDEDGSAYYFCDKIGWVQTPFEGNETY